MKKNLGFGTESDSKGRISFLLGFRNKSLCDSNYD